MMVEQQLAQIDMTLVAIAVHLMFANDMRMIELRRNLGHSSVSLATETLKVAEAMRAWKEGPKNGGKASGKPSGD